MVKPLIYLGMLSLLLASPVLAVDFEDVLRMLDARVDEEVILRLIDQEQAVFVLDADDIVDLQYAGASDWFLEEMIDRSVEPSRSSGRNYGVYDDYNVYVRIGGVYDPFDYYFVTWPYYYAYVSPWRWTRSWWYYGGPVHAHWCHSWNWRVQYYHDYWGPRSVWHRGYRDRVYHVPRYDVTEKVMRKAVHDRSLASRVKDVRHRSDRPNRAIYDRRKADGKSPRAAADRKQVRSQRPTRKAPVWGRNDRSKGSREPSRTPSRSVRKPRSTPPKSSTTTPRAPTIRQPRSTKSAPSPPRSTSRSSSGSRSPSRPSRSGSR